MLSITLFKSKIIFFPPFCDQNFHSLQKIIWKIVCYWTEIYNNKFLMKFNTYKKYYFFTRSKKTQTKKISYTFGKNPKKILLISKKSQKNLINLIDLYKDLTNFIDLRYLSISYTFFEVIYPSFTPWFDSEIV